MTKFFESDTENFAIELLKKQSHAYLLPEEQTLGRGNLSYVIRLVWGRGGSQGVVKTPASQPVFG